MPSNTLRVAKLVPMFYSTSITPNVPECLVFHWLSFFVPFRFKVWFGEHMFTDNFRFYTGYVIPKCQTLEQFMEAIQALPSVDTPQVFGLHPNADITSVWLLTITSTYSLALELGRLLQSSSCFLET